MHVPIQNMFNDENFQGNANDYPWHGRFNRKQIFADFCFSTFADFQGQYILVVRYILYTLQVYYGYIRLASAGGCHVGDRRHGHRTV